LREVLKEEKYYVCKVYKYSAISGNIEMSKICCKCKSDKPLEKYGNLKCSPDGLRYDCKDCRSKYNLANRERVKKKNSEYYENNKADVLEKNKCYRIHNSETIAKQRQEYRSRENIKEHIKKKNKDYLPVRKLKIKERRQQDLNFRLSEILRSKIHKMLKNKKTSYSKYLGCDVEMLKKWLEFRFDTNMNWTNVGEYWHIDHIIPINKFDFSKESDIKICFHWTNLQPLTAYENRQKSDKIVLHYYYNNIVNIYRFNKKYTQNMGYEAVNESLQWLRVELRYRKNAPYEDVTTSEIDNPQPSL
jgi:transposase-like protein